MYGLLGGPMDDELKRIAGYRPRVLSPEGPPPQLQPAPTEFPGARPGIMAEPLQRRGGGFGPTQMGLLAASAAAFQTPGVQGGGAAIGRALEAGVPAYLAAKQQQAEQQKREQMLAQRDAIFRAFPPRKNETRQQTNQRLREILPYLVQIGDPSVTQLVEYLKSQQENDQDFVANVPEGGALVDKRTGKVLYQGTRKPPQLEARDLGNRVGWFDPTTGKEVRSDPKGATPRDPNLSYESDRRELRIATNQMADDYRMEVKDNVKAYNLIGSGLRHTDRALNGDGAAQVEMLYAFVRALDPGSVVREGETRLVQAALPLWQRAKALKDDILAGKSRAVPPGMAQQIAQSLRDFAQNYEEQLRDAREHYVSLGREFGVKESAFRNYIRGPSATVRRLDGLLRKPTP